MNPNVDLIACVSRDTTAFKMTYENADGDWVTSYATNQEVYEMSNPEEYHLHYVYENFEWYVPCHRLMCPRGPHYCTLQGLL